MGSSRMIGGVYHPGARGGAMSDALTDAKYAMNRLMRVAALRSAGLLLVLAAAAALVALVSYSSDDASLNNANLRDASNWLGAFGAVAADLLLQIFGWAALAFLAPLFVWGARALRGKSLKYAMWRLLAWPLGTLTVAAGLGLLPPLTSLPAGAGGMIGIAANGLSAHAALVWQTPALAWALPLGLLIVGLPLAFLATGLRFVPIARGIMNIPAGMAWLITFFKKPNFSFAHHDDEGDHEYEDDDEGAYHLDADEPGSLRPEPIAAARLAERQQSRVRRDARVAQSKRADKQPALNLASGDYQLPALGLLTEAPPVKNTHTLSDEALEENARMLEAALTLALGKTIGGEPVMADLAKMPHLLVAGTTGSGKSVGLNTMILSLLYRMSPEQCRLIMIDPKMLELSVYDGIPHLLSPVVTEPKKAIVALKWVVREMENRYRSMSKLGVRNVEGYNQRLAQAVAAGETLMRRVQTGFDPE